MQSKALVTLLATLGVAAVSHAQVAFQVAGPQNGATVRETVKIRIPVAALDNVKYLALTVDGKFRAGVAVPTPVQTRDKKTGLRLFKTDLVERDEDKNTVTFLWNTKAKVRDADTQQILDGVDDGPHTIEMIAYDAANKKLGKQTLTLTVNNRGDLRMPADGISLVYHFAVGDANSYHQRTDLEYVNEVKVPKNTVLGGRARSGYFSQGGGRSGGGGAGAMMGGGDGMGSGMGQGRGSMGQGRGSMATMGGGDGMGQGRGGMGQGRGSMGQGRGSMGGAMSGSGPMMGGGGMGQGRGSMGQGRGSMGGGDGMGGSGPMMGGGGAMMGGGMMGGGEGSPFVGPKDAGPFRIPVQTVKANYTRTTEDRLNSSEYFVRDRVENGTIVGSGGAARLEDIYNFKSRYRAVASTGQVKDPGIANGAHPGAYVALPFIDFGNGKRRIGQKWVTKAPVLLEWATLDVPTMVPAQNTLEGLEWESGYQCAKIRQTFDGQANIPIYGGAGKIQNAKVKMDRTIWFSYKAGRIIKMETTTEVDGDTPSDILAVMVPQAGSGSTMGGMMGGGGDLGGGDGIGGGPVMSGGGPMMGGGGAMGRGSSMGQGRGSMGGPMMGGGDGGGPGFGGMQGGTQQEAPKVPAKFRSLTVVEYVAPGAAAPVKK